MPLDVTKDVPLSSADHSKMVGVAQLVERQTVDLDVAGSNPVTHPMILKDFHQIVFAGFLDGLRGGCVFARDSDLPSPTASMNRISALGIGWP